MADLLGVRDVVMEHMPECIHSGPDQFVRPS